MCYVLNRILFQMCDDNHFFSNAQLTLVLDAQVKHYESVCLKDCMFVFLVQSVCLHCCSLLVNSKSCNFDTLLLKKFIALSQFIWVSATQGIQGHCLI